MKIQYVIAGKADCLRRDARQTGTGVQIVQRVKVAVNCTLAATGCTSRLRHPPQSKKKYSVI